MEEKKADSFAAKMRARRGDKPAPERWWETPEELARKVWVWCRAAQVGNLPRAIQARARMLELLRTLKLFGSSPPKLTLSMSGEFVTLNIRSWGGGRCQIRVFQNGAGRVTCRRGRGKWLSPQVCDVDPAHWGAGVVRAIEQALYDQAQRKCQNTSGKRGKRARRDRGW